MGREIYVRWMDAYRHSSREKSFKQVVHYEARTLDERACEKVEGRARVQAYWGLLVNPEHIFRCFNYDCWSERNGSGRLHETRTRHHATVKNSKYAYKNWHTECWFHGGQGAIVGIVLRANNMHEVSSVVLGKLKSISVKESLPVYMMDNKGILTEIKN